MLGVLADEALDQPFWLALSQSLGLAEPYRSSFIAIRDDHLAIPIRRHFLPSVDDCRIAILNGTFNRRH